MRAPDAAGRAPHPSRLRAPRSIPLSIGRRIRAGADTRDRPYTKRKGPEGRGREVARALPILARNIVQTPDDRSVVGLDCELATCIEAAGRKIDRADDRSFAVGEQHLRVQPQTF